MSLEGNLWVGIGCQRGTSSQFIEAAIKHVFQENNLLEGAIAGVATIDSKVNEVGLIQFCSERDLPLVFFSAEELQNVNQNVNLPNPSQIVASIVQTVSVAEAAAIIALCKSCNLNVETLHVTSLDVTSLDVTSLDVTSLDVTSLDVTSLDVTSLDVTSLLRVPKQIIRSVQNLKGAVTLAVAYSTTLKT